MLRYCVSVSCEVNKFTSVFNTSVLSLMINCVITLSQWLWNHEPQASGSTVNFDNFGPQNAQILGFALFDLQHSCLARMI